MRSQIVFGGKGGTPTLGKKVAWCETIRSGPEINKISQPDHAHTSQCSAVEVSSLLEST